MVKEHYEWIVPKYRDKSIKKDGKINKDSLRLKVASEEVKKAAVKIEDVITYSNEFLELLGMEAVGNPKVEFKGDISKKLKEAFKNIEKEVEDKRDVVWMKFTTDGYLGVVATSADVNFEMNTTSGAIIKHLKKEWNKDFILLFPLKNIPENLNRQCIESGMGNYLISKNVPILDLYSHNL